MTQVKGFLAALLSSSVLIFGALIPFVASADMYPYNCSNYDASWYGNSYWNQNCTNNQGTLLVYVQVPNNNWNNGYTYRSPSDFTVFISGANTSQNSFPGSQNGTSVRLTGSYAVTIQNPMGYNPSYSIGCNGTVSAGQTQTCVISMTNTGGYYPPTYPNYPSYQYQPVTYTAKFIPALPNTGFEPISAEGIAFAIVLLVASGLLVSPYVRKFIIATVR